MPHAQGNAQLWQVRGGVCSRVFSAEPSATTADSRFAKPKAAENGEWLPIAAATAWTMQILQQIDDALMLPHTACDAQQEHHCSTRRVNVNLQTVETRRSATRKVSTQTVTSRRNALAALQVNDYPMPMTPAAATATEMLPMPPLEQTGEVARTEASPAHRNMSSLGQ